MIAVRVNKPSGGREFIQGELVRANKKSVIVEVLKRKLVPKSRWLRFLRRLKVFFLGEKKEYKYIKRNIHRDLLPLAKR